MTAVTLGDFEFQDFEVPEHIPFGAEQSLVIHKLIGGVRQIDAMGSNPSAMSWSGWFVGSNAMARAEELQNLVQAGASVALTWDALSYTVVVGSIACDFKMAWRIPYSITCEPVSNDSQPTGTTTDTDTDQLVADDTANTGALAASVGDQALTSDVSSVATAISALGLLANASVASIRAVNQSIAVAQARAEALQAANAPIVAAPSVSFDTTPSGLSMFAVALTASAAASQEASNLAVVDATLSRISVNLTADINGPRTIAIVSGDLYSIAAAEYGDATLWTVIANANGLTDPIVSSPANLIIPQKPANSSGGVLNA